MLNDAWIKRDLEPGIRCADGRNGKELDQDCSEWRAFPLPGSFESAASG